jgi:hypothetical protein
LRVEIGRLRRMLRTLATVSATKSGFLLAPCRAREVVVLARPVEDEHGAVRCLPFSPTVNPGRARPWRWHWVPASAPCSGRSTRSRPQAECRRSAAPGLAVG